MKSIAVVSPSPDPAAGWSNRLRIAVGGQGLIAHAGWCCRGCWPTGSG
ncbi:MAG: hypothetical protein IPL36_09725 [Nigerium sp.]|nr:hypothetical protein [Nigerium sp.]